MDSHDGGASTVFEPASSNTEPTFTSPSARLAALSAASPLCLPPHDLLSLEALERRDPSSSHSEAPSDRLFQDPSSSMADDSSEFPWRDISSSSSQQQQGDISLLLPAKASAESLWQESSSSRELFSQSVFSSDRPINDSLANEYSDEKAHHFLHNASPLHPLKEALLSEAPAEGLCQNPSAEAVSHGPSSFDEDSQAEELQPSISANQFLHANPLEQSPVAMSAYNLFDASREEESHCTSEEQEVPDDVKREMLKEKYKGVAILSCNSEAMGGPSYVYMVGTAHVSEESCREVRAVISLMKPELVFVELCQKRSFILRRRHLSVPTVSDFLASWKESRSNFLGVLYSWFLAKVAAKLDVLPGSEFRAAYEEATACGARVVLGDRDIEVTLRRTWVKMSMWHKTKFISAIILQAFCLPKADQLNELIEKLQDTDMLTLAFEELGNIFPTVIETIVDERDMFMAAVLQKLGEDNSSIVAVVGRGHVAGIRKHWGQDICIQNLLEIPPTQSIWTRTFKLYVVSALFALTSTILYVYYR